MIVNRKYLFVVFFAALFISALGLYSPAFAQCTDADGDGFNAEVWCAPVDCNDNDPTVYPGAPEICDGQDNNCDYWKPPNDVDADGDGVALCAGDCNDNDPNAFPGNSELCGDGIDNNCNYFTDEAGCICPDADGDGATAAYCGGTDCDDSDPNVQTNCAGCTDADGDGVAVEGGSCGPVDCDDTDPNVKPGVADICDGKDTDCDGWQAPSDVDADGDGVALCAGDCNDNDASILPGATEVCGDGIDNNCNYITDEAGCICPDADGDGHMALYCGGTDCDDTDPNIFQNCPGCTDGDGDNVFAEGGNCGPVDCDDTDPNVRPGAAEICDGKDSDCDGWKPPSDVDVDGDGVALCANDCDDNDPARFPGNPEHVLRNTCADAIDNDCDNAVDAGDSDCIGSCTTGTNPKNGPHFFTLLNPDDTVHPQSGTLNCGKCHSADFADPVRYACQRCHVNTADPADPHNGTIKAQYPLDPPYGYGTAPDVSMHVNWTLGDQGCVVCHNPHTQEQDGQWGTTYGMYVKEYICYNPKGIMDFVEFTSNTGTGSFADGSPYTANICNTCHTMTNHHQNDGTAPGGQDHNNGQDCMQCHAHDGGFAPTGGVAPPPHDAQNCNTCHVAEPDYAAPVPNSACLSCHDGTGSTLIVDTHYSDTYTDPTTGALMNLECIECHNPMYPQANLVFIRDTLRGNPVVFTAYSGPNSFADGGAPYDGVCEVCHTQTNHHRNDGLAPFQSHNDGTDCRGCHDHNNGFQPVIAVPAPHDAQNCNTCHVAEPDYASLVPNTACLSCHDGTGSTLIVDTHFSDTYTDPTTGALMSLNCVECHNPMYPQANLVFIRDTLRGNPVVFTAYSGPNSFADGGAPYDGVCEVCHTQTNHHRNDGLAPFQSHNDGTDCRGCHDHNNGFQPVIAVPAPHDAQNCNTCHVAEPDYASLVPNTACLSCHDGTGSTLVVDTHFSDTYTDPTTGALMNLNCVECHNPMYPQTNIVFIRDTLRGNPVVFTSYTGPNSFADGGAPYDGVCEVCHTQTNHHRNDGFAPQQSHNDAQDCRVCHLHIDGFQPSGDCTQCHNVTQPNGAGDYRRQVVGTGGDIDNGKTSHHVQYTTLDALTCEVCHDQSNHTNNIEPGVLLNDPDGGASIAYSGNASELTMFCLNCHDADAANGNTTPFADSGDNMTPANVAADWNQAFGHRAVGVACMDCHGDSGGTGGPTDPIINAHGSDDIKMLNASYDPNNQLGFCETCHGGSGIWGKDVTLEFDPNNNSRHPIGMPISDNLKSSQLSGGWSPGDTMTCSDCHDGGTAGPHGSATKWMLAGNNKAWPYQNVSDNGTSSGSFFYIDGTRNNLFCANCHPDTGRSGNRANEVHDDSHHNQSPEGRCVNCHIRVPHGGSVSRLINAAMPFSDLPARLRPNGNGGGTQYLMKFRQTSNASNYDKDNCYSTVGICDDHDSNITGESW